MELSVGGWSFCFYLGFGIDRIIETKKDKIVAVIAGIISFAVSLVQIYLEKAPHIFDLAPTFTAITCTIYILLKGIKIKNKYLRRCVFFAGRHSFGVYMVHWVIMLKVLECIPMQTDLYFVYLLKIVFITFSFSLLIGTVFDTTVIRLVKKIGSNLLQIKKLEKQ